MLILQFLYQEAEAQLDREENDQDDKSTASSDSAGESWCLHTKNYTQY